MLKFGKKKTIQRPDMKVEEVVLFLKQVLGYLRERLTRKVRVEFDDLETVDYNNDTSISGFGRKKKYRTQIVFNKIIKKYKTLARKKLHQDVVFVKRVPVHLMKTKDEVKFVKQVLLNPRERSKRNRKIDLHNYSQLSKKRKNNDQVIFIKLVPIHPHPRSHPQKLTALNGKVQFVKQLPVHPHDRLERLKNKPQKR